MLECSYTHGDKARPISGCAAREECGRLSGDLNTPFGVLELHVYLPRGAELIRYAVINDLGQIWGSNRRTTELTAPVISSEVGSPLGWVEVCPVRR